MQMYLVNMNDQSMGGGEKKCKGVVSSGIRHERGNEQPNIKKGMYDIWVYVLPENLKSWRIKN